MSGVELFKPTKLGHNIKLEKDSATVITPNSFVALDGSYEAIEATAGSTAIAWTKEGAGAGETSVLVYVDPEAEYRITPDANFAKSMRGTTCDIAVSSNDFTADVGASLTDVIKISPDENNGVVGATDDIVVKIVKPLF